MVKKIRRIKSVAAPLLQKNIDTDVIIPMHRYVMADKSEIHRFAFESLRYSADGEKDPTFVLNQPRFEKAEILIVGQNFGCGSSREAAVWAIVGLGIKCIIGQSFGNIFFGNCFQNGILAVILPEKAINTLSDISKSCSGKPEFTVDLSNETIKDTYGQIWKFEIDNQRKTQLLQGLDSISMTLKHKEEIEKFRHKDKTNRPWVYI